MEKVIKEKYLFSEHVAQGSSDRSLKMA